MHPALTILGRILAGGAGALLIYASMFLCEKEQRGIKNTLEEWWIKITDAKEQAISLQTAFLKTVAEITSRGFNYIFGKRLFSLKAAAASICYSQAAVFLVSVVPSLFTSIRDWTFQDRAGCILCLSFLVLGSLGPFIENAHGKLIWLVSSAIASVIWLPLVSYIDDASNAAKIRSTFYLATAYALPFAVASDFLFIALNAGGFGTSFTVGFLYWDRGSSDRECPIGSCSLLYPSVGGRHCRVGLLHRPYCAYTYWILEHSRCIRISSSAPCGNCDVIASGLVAVT